MIERDKKVYKALKFLSKGNKSFIDSVRVDNHGEYYDNLPDEIKTKLINLGYIKISVDPNEPMLTDKGLEHLRMLGDISRKDWSLTISWIAIAISFLSFLIAQGWITLK